MPTPWADSVKNRNPKQLTIFVAPTLNKPWRRAFDDALSTFNQLSQDNRLGVTMVAPENATKPDPNGEGGADVQFDMGKGDITFSALGQDFQLKNFSGTSMHGKTELLRGSKKPLCMCRKPRWSWHKWRSVAVNSTTCNER
jgi:hypothetical protein